MSNKTPFLFVFLLSCLIAGAQTSRKADSLYSAKNFTAAAPLYVRAATITEFNSSKASNYYNAACCFALMNEKDSAFMYLEKAAALGWNNKAHLLQDADLTSLHESKKWKRIVKNMKPPQGLTDDPLKVNLVTVDINNFWKAYDLAKKDTARRLAIYKELYVDKGTPGLQDYFPSKVGNMRSFVLGHDRRAKFYEGIRANTLLVEHQKQQMMQSLVKFKGLYPAAKFADVYFMIGNFTSAGTVSQRGLLIGVDQYSRTDDIPLDELNLWEKNNFQRIENLPHLIAHELIHFNQAGLASDTTTLSAALREGMADFFGELISGKTSNERLQVWVKGKEKQVWEDFKREMWLNRARNWIANSSQETPDHPADLGYWIGYMMCKAYYEKAADKKQAAWDILNIKDYKAFYEKSGVEEYITRISFP